MGPRLWRAACYSEAGMRRGLHITITLMAVVLLLRPFDCLDGSSPKRQAMECCLKGKCAPTAKADECCKKTTPDYNQLAPSKAADHSSPLIAFIAIHVPELLPPIFQASREPVRHPPPRIESTTPSLPLLI